MASHSYMTEGEYLRAKQDIYDSLRYIFNTTKSSSKYKEKAKMLRRSVKNARLLPYFDRIRERFYEYLVRKNIDQISKTYQEKNNINYNVKEIFKEASGLHRRGTAFEQGNLKYSTKIIYIAKKN